MTLYQRNELTYRNICDEGHLLRWREEGRRGKSESGGGKRIQNRGEGKREEGTKCVEGVGLRRMMVAVKRWKWKTRDGR